ncbi:hypothetical protein MUP32_04610 [Candidatus Microgenomates bacterium]|nr:hypothetical protein [Candidatus Microgenomates bacterium]
MNIQLIVNEKKELIKSKSGDEVKVVEEMPERYRGHGALIDFPFWYKGGCAGLPTIFIDKSVDKVHILHELVHLEKFFVEKYPIVVSSSDFHYKIDVFKNIAEDYLAHKIIFNVYGLNPISPAFLLRNNVNDNRSDKQLAADLTHYYFFSEFDKEYKKKLGPFMTNCRRQRYPAYSIAQMAIKCISEIDYKDKSSYEKGIKELINVFEPNDSYIYLEFFEKDGSVWKSFRV